MKEAGHVVVCLPEDAWNLMIETLYMDSQSSFFDDDLRQDITEAIESIVYVKWPDDECPDCDNSGFVAEDEPCSCEVDLE